MYLKTKNGCNDIPKGAVGRVIDILIDDYGNTMFLLEFDDDCEWFASYDIEPCDHADSQN